MFTLIICCSPQSILCFRTEIPMFICWSYPLNRSKMSKKARIVCVAYALIELDWRMIVDSWNMNHYYELLIAATRDIQDWSAFIYIRFLYSNITWYHLIGSFDSLQINGFISFDVFWLSCLVEKLVVVIRNITDPIKSLIELPPVLYRIIRTGSIDNEYDDDNQHHCAQYWIYMFVKYDLCSIKAEHIRNMIGSSH